MKDIIENFHSGTTLEAEMEIVEPAAEEPKVFVVAAFRPAYNRLLLKRLPMPEPKPGQIIAPQIAEEQSEYGYIVSVGRDVEECRTGDVAKFSKHSGPEEIHFEDEEPGDEYIVVYKEDIRGYFELGARADA